MCTVAENISDKGLVTRLYNKILVQLHEMDIDIYFNMNVGIDIGLWRGKNASLQSCLSLCVL